VRLSTACLVALLLGMSMSGACQSVGEERAEVSAPATPAAAKDILAARRFTLRTPYTHTAGKESISVSTGVLVVLEAEPDYLIPRETLNPVLYAGDTIVLRLNHGHRSGRVIGIVPGDIDLATVPIWFGTPELPERVTKDMIESERARAEQAGVRAFARARVDAVRRPPVEARDLAALLRTAGADLVYEFSPQEKELADSWRLPVVKAPPKRQAD
jgi:hypothetical protein